jgi:hypothetical protein
MASQVVSAKRVAVVGHRARPREEADDVGSERRITRACARFTLDRVSKLADADRLAPRRCVLGETVELPLGQLVALSRFLASLLLFFPFTLAFRVRFGDLALTDRDRHEPDHHVVELFFEAYSLSVAPHRAWAVLRLVAHAKL